MPNMSLVPMESASLRGTGKHPNISVETQIPLELAKHIRSLGPIH